MIRVQDIQKLKDLLNLRELSRISGVPYPRMLRAAQDHAQQFTVDESKSITDALKTSGVTLFGEELED